MDKEIALIAGSFHKEKIEKMCVAARSEAVTCGLKVSREIWIPGSFEVPLALKRVLVSKSVAGVALLGIIERGQTKHGMAMAQAIFPAIVQLQLEYNTPVGLGIIGPEVLEEQIDPRIEPHARAAVRAIHTMLELEEV